MEKIIVVIPLPRDAAIRMARRKAGIDIIVSTILIMILSTMPPK
jgi:hypothetical protein